MCDIVLRQSRSVISPTVSLGNDTNTVSLSLIACDNSGSSKPNDFSNKTTIKIITPKQAINFTLADNPHLLNEYLEKEPVMLMFFTTWWPYCKKEIPKLEQVYQQYSDQGLQLVAINAGIADTLENAKHYALQHRLPYTLLYDEDARVASQHGLQTVPKIFYIQQNGNIVHTSRKVSKL